MQNDSSLHNDEESGLDESIKEVKRKNAVAGDDMSQEVVEKIDKTIAAHERVLKDIEKLTISKDELLKRNEELK